MSELTIDEKNWLERAENYLKIRQSIIESWKTDINYYREVISGAEHHIKLCEKHIELEIKDFARNQEVYEKFKKEKGI